MVLAVFFCFHRSLIKPNGGNLLIGVGGVFLLPWQGQKMITFLNRCVINAFFNHFVNGL